MTPAEFRIVREGLGLTGLWLAYRWGIAPRTVERWEAGVSTIADFAADDLALLEVTAAEHVARHVEAMTGDDQPLLSIQDVGADTDLWPARWQRAVTFRVRQQVPGLLIIDAEKAQGGES